MPNHFGGVTPTLNVSSFAASIDYYVGRLGFTKKWDWGEPPTFGCVGRDNVSVFLCQGRQGQPGTWLMVFVENVDDLHAEYKERDAKIVGPPTNMPWGSREMHVEDPDGHRIRFGSDVTAPANADEVKKFWEAVEVSDD
jgi:catechol 2,3-dioxygenase-like lactoylglutathione lyase family enzyme